MISSKHLVRLALAATFALSTPLAAFAQTPADESQCASAKSYAAATAPTSAFVRTGASGKWTKIDPTSYQTTFNSAVTSQTAQQIGRVWKEKGKVGYASIDSFSGGASAPTTQSYCYRHNGSLAMIGMATYNPATKTFSNVQMLKMNPGGTALANASPPPVGVKLYSNPNNLPFSTLITGP